MIKKEGEKVSQRKFTPEEILALRAVYRGCNTNKRLIGSTYVYNFGTEDEVSISYYDALKVVENIIEAATKS